MLAHLSRSHLVRGNFRTGAFEYEKRSLHFSGAQAEGDELEDPVAVVIDIGGDFTINHGKLWPHRWEHGEPVGPWRVYQLAMLMQAGFTLLWDERQDADDEAKAAKAKKAADAARCYG